MLHIRRKTKTVIEDIRKIAVSTKECSKANNSSSFFYMWFPLYVVGSFFVFVFVCFSRSPMSSVIFSLTLFCNH